MFLILKTASCLVEGQDKMCQKRLCIDIACCQIFATLSPLSNVSQWGLWNITAEGRDNVSNSLNIVAVSMSPDSPEAGLCLCAVSPPGAGHGECGTLVTCHHYSALEAPDCQAEWVTHWGECPPSVSIKTFFFFLTWEISNSIWNKETN